MGSDNTLDCIDCLAGKYVEDTGSNEASDCIDCPHDTYNDVAGSDQQVHCIDCTLSPMAGSPHKKYTVNTGSDTIVNCIFRPETHADLQSATTAWCSGDEITNPDTVRLLGRGVVGVKLFGREIIY